MNGKTGETFHAYRSGEYLDPHTIQSHFELFPWSILQLKVYHSFYKAIMATLRHLFTRESQPTLTTEIHLQNDLVVVHPTPSLTGETETTLAVPQLTVDNETLLSGCVIVVSESDVLLWNITIALVIYCKYRRPGEDVWQQGIIYEQGRVFNHLDREARVSTSADRRHIHRQIDFALMVPSSIPTHEYLPHAIILPQIRVSVEYSRNTWSDAALRALPSTPPVYVDEHPEGRTVAGRQMRTSSYSGGDVKWPPAGTPKCHILVLITNLISVSPHTRPDRHSHHTWLVIARCTQTSGTDVDQKLCNYREWQCRRG